MGPLGLVLALHEGDKYLLCSLLMNVCLTVYFFSTLLSSPFTLYFTVHGCLFNSYASNPILGSVPVLRQDSTLLQWCGINGIINSWPDIS